MIKNISAYVLKNKKGFCTESLCEKNVARVRMSAKTKMNQNGESKPGDGSNFLLSVICNIVLYATFNCFHIHLIYCIAGTRSLSVYSPLYASIEKF